MCIQYSCQKCRQPSGIYCVSATKKGLEYYCDEPTIDLWPGSKSCQTCLTISQVTQKLKELLFREPWLATTGMGGAPAKESWEEKTAIDWYPDSDNDDEGLQDGFTKAEREQFRAKIMQSHTKKLITTEQAITQGGIEPCSVTNEDQNQDSSQATAWGDETKADKEREDKEWTTITNEEPGWIDKNAENEPPGTDWIATTTDTSAQSWHNDWNGGTWMW